jgi:homoserine kinase
MDVARRAAVDCGDPVGWSCYPKARAALDHVRGRRDFNLQRVLSLVTRCSIANTAHEAVRGSLAPTGACVAGAAAREVIALEDPDVLGAFLSGAGPSVALLVRRDEDRIAQMLTSLYSRAGVEATVRTLHVHHGAPAPALSIGH